MPSYIVDFTGRQSTNYCIDNAFTRSGKLSFSGLIYFILQATHKSLSINYAQLRTAFSPATNLPLVSKQVLSKARKKFAIKHFLHYCEFL